MSKPYLRATLSKNVTALSIFGQIADKIFGPRWGFGTRSGENCAKRCKLGTINAGDRNDINSRSAHPAWIQTYRRCVERAHATNIRSQRRGQSRVYCQLGESSRDYWLGDASNYTEGISPPNNGRSIRIGAGRVGNNGALYSSHEIVRLTVVRGIFKWQSFETNKKGKEKAWSSKRPLRQLANRSHHAEPVAADFVEHQIDSIALSR